MLELRVQREEIFQVTTKNTVMEEQKDSILKM